MSNAKSHRVAMPMTVQTRLADDGHDLKNQQARNADLIRDDFVP